MREIMTKLFNLEITERKLLFLSFIMIVVLSVGLVQSYHTGGVPAVFHSGDQLTNTCHNPVPGSPEETACNAAKAAHPLWDPNLISIYAAEASNGGGGGGSTSSTVCVQIVGKNQPKCDTTLGTDWILQGSSQQTVDAIWCGMKETQANDWWAKFGGASSNQNLLGASWGIGNSFSTDADPSNIINANPGYTTSTLVTITTPQTAGVLGLNPPVWRSSVPPFSQIGVCGEGVVSWRSFCCKTF